MLPEVGEEVAVSIGKCDGRKPWPDAMGLDHLTFLIAKQWRGRYL